VFGLCGGGIEEVKELPAFLNWQHTALWNWQRTALWFWAV
jgi:hypothetical protein